MDCKWLCENIVIWSTYWGIIEFDIEAGAIYGELNLENLSYRLAELPIHTCS